MINWNSMEKDINIFLSSRKSSGYEETAIEISNIYNRYVTLGGNDQYSNVVHIVNKLGLANELINGFRECSKVKKNKVNNIIKLHLLRGLKKYWKNALLTVNAFLAVGGTSGISNVVNFVPNNISINWPDSNNNSKILSSELISTFKNFHKEIQGVFTVVGPSPNYATLTFPWTGIQ